MTQTLNGRIPDASPDKVFPVFAQLAEALELECVEEAGSFSMKLAGGELRLSPARDALALSLSAESERRLYLLQQMVLNRLDALDPAPKAEWERVDAGALPPNLSIALVESSTLISPNFRRLRLRFPDVARYAEDGLHFRLVISALPPDQAEGGSVREWPRIGENGRTRWPEGELALHRPVYTIREIDAAAGWMDVDVFLHEGGRVSAWTERVASGDRIGLMGPTTRGAISAGWVGFWGDETALPAIARHCAALPAATRGVIRISLGDMADRQDFARPEGMELVWTPRRAQGLLEDLQATALPGEDRFVFFAAGGEEADAARTWLRSEQGFDKTDSNVTGYWR
ncbi:siderophore-interacting protein [Neomegalonema perideroedes]|uniref:siderophore-interacting protein n=1 Tax=Neomegalonema perideroedes TaxID=217219 RepID=UPI0003678878|nr:siderophore-interacting protein [Neomegalonema perideroedes]